MIMPAMIDPAVKPIGEGIKYTAASVTPMSLVQRKYGERLETC